MDTIIVTGSKNGLKGQVEIEGAQNTKWCKIVSKRVPLWWQRQ